MMSVKNASSNFIYSKQDLTELKYDFIVGSEELAILQKELSEKGKK